MVPMVLVGIAYVVTVSWWTAVDQRRGVKKRCFNDFRRAPGISALLLAFQVSFLVLLVPVGSSMMTWSPWQVMLLTTGYGLAVLVLLLVYNTKAGPPRQQQQATPGTAPERDAL